MKEGFNLIKDQYSLLESLGEQVYFLQKSIEEYDSGVIIEAKRIATILRILFHHTSKSKALLYLLDDLDKTYFLSTSVPYSENNLLTHFGLLNLHASNDGAKMKARLSKDITFSRWVTFDTWWNEIIIKDENSQTYTRKQLITKIANTDGGAHVDDNTTLSYENLKTGKGTGWYFKGSNSKIEQHINSNVAFESIREIAFEVLHSLKNKDPMLDIKIF